MTETVFEVWFLNSKGEPSGKMGYIYRTTDKVEEGMILQSFRRTDKHSPYGNPAKVTEIISVKDEVCDGLRVRCADGEEREVYSVTIESATMSKPVKTEYTSYNGDIMSKTMYDPVSIVAPTYVDTADFIEDIMRGLKTKTVTSIPKEESDYLTWDSATWVKYPTMPHMKIKEKKTMDFKSVFKNFNLDFGRIETSRLAVAANGAIAVRDAAGTYKTYKNGEIVDMTGLTLDEMPLMKMPVALKQLAAGDTIFHNGNKILFVDAIEDGEVIGVDIAGAERVHVLPVKSPFGFNFITKIVNPMGAMFGGASEDEPWGAMLPFMFMKDEGGDGMGMAMAMAMMGKNGFNMDCGNGFNPMMFAMMGKGSSGDMFETMMTMQMMQNMMGQGQDKSEDK